MGKLVKIDSDECLEFTKKTIRQLFYIRAQYKYRYPYLFIKKGHHLYLDLDEWLERQKDLLEVYNFYVRKLLENDKNTGKFIRITSKVYFKICAEGAIRKYRGDKNWTIGNVVDDAIELLLKENN